MKAYTTKVIHLPIGAFIFGFNLKSWGLGVRFEVYGVTIDFLCIWMAWER